ncbi:hypothetical protein MKW94_021494 [Papaver nudicaule]|uniref:Wax synthase domain-containing protein n=1 Tax=Papaver nudicaule TaxID=74823 RepID=A0AA41S341_PAPNU|nr:hypothetical protein [Papaver nudicaule]
MDEYVHVRSSDHDDQFGRYLNVCITIFASLTYCYAISRNIPKGFPRLLSVLPIIYIFTLIPFQLSSSFHLVMGAGFFICPLACLKLVLFSFDKGPLISSQMTYLRFLAIACLPIKLTLAIHAVLARLVFHIDADPPFGNHFLLSTSFQDFWGKRWNLMVSDILRQTVYKPVRHVFSRSWGMYVAILATFTVSGLLHELLLFYAGRQQPRWDLLGFFILHGTCLAVEVRVKRSLNGKWQLNRLFSTALMNGFLICSCFWLFLPCFERLNVRVMVIEDLANFTKLLSNVLK